MTGEQIVQILGALLLLAGFLLSQRNVLDPGSYPYLVLNLAGSALLAFLAYQERRWGFVLLEGVWAVASLAGLVLRAREKEPAAGH